MQLMTLTFKFMNYDILSLILTYMLLISLYSTVFFVYTYTCIHFHGLVVVVFSYYAPTKFSWQIFGLTHHPH